MKCPYCQKEITELIYSVTEYNSYIFYLNEKGESEYEWDEGISEDGAYLCPECSGELFYSEEDAKKFLKGEDEK